MVWSTPAVRPGSVADQPRPHGLRASLMLEMLPVHFTCKTRAGAVLLLQPTPTIKYLERYQ
jgi:hypothetical protein